MVALLVCLAPTTIGALLSAIGIAGMSRLNQANVLAMSGRAIEAAGDVDILMLDKTGTITLGNRKASAFIPVDGANERELADAAQLSSLADETPEGRSVVILAKEKFNIRGRELSDKNMTFIPFTAKTRMSGVDYTRAERRRTVCGKCDGGRFPPSHFGCRKYGFKISGGLPNRQHHAQRMLSCLIHRCGRKTGYCCCLESKLCSYC